MQDRYDVRPKQLALYLTGRRYMGGSDRKRRTVWSRGWCLNIQKDENPVNDAVIIKQKNINILF